MDIQNSLPISFIVVGREWILNETGIEPEELQKIYAGPTSCYVKKNNTYEENGNIFAAGTIVGFLTADDYSQLKKIQAQVDFPLDFILRAPQWNVTSYPILTIQKSNPRKAQKKYIRPEFSHNKASPITQRQYSKQKHPISKVAFAPKRNLESFFQKHNNKTGIYSIYSNDFATYIGQARDIGKRLRQHVRALNNGKHHNDGLQHAWNTKGASKFTFFVINECREEDLDEFEQLYIKKYRTFEFGYNNTPDGQGGKPVADDAEPILSNSLSSSSEGSDELSIYRKSCHETLNCTSPEQKSIETSTVRNIHFQEARYTGESYASVNIESKNDDTNSNGVTPEVFENTRAKNVSDKYDAPDSVTPARSGPQHLTKEVIAEKVRLINASKKRSKSKRISGNTIAMKSSIKTSEGNCVVTRKRLDALLIDIERYITPPRRKLLTSIRGLRLVKKLKLDAIIMSEVCGRVAELSERLDRSAVHLSKYDMQDFEKRLLKIKRTLRI